MYFNEFSKIDFVGDQAIRITFGSEVSIAINNRVQMFNNYLKNINEPLFQEIIPSFTSLLIIYNLKEVLKKSNQEGIKDPSEFIYLKVEELLNRTFTINEENKEIIEIPVCYDGEFAPDLEEVAILNSLTMEEVIEKHTSREYFIYMLGFAPGFPYLAGVDSQIATPRKQSPRLRIEAGSVGIAGSQTGIYPIATPGGWQIIGRTPKKLFTPDSENPTLLKAGQWIRFKRISEKEFFLLEESD